MGAEDARERGEVDVAIVDAEDAPAVEFLLERALVAEAAIVEDDAHHRDALAHRGLELADVAHHPHVADAGHHRLVRSREHPALRALQSSTAIALVSALTHS